MAVSTEHTKDILMGDGVNIKFPFTFQVIDKKQIRCLKVLSSGEEIEVLNTEFDVNLNNNGANGGEITFPLVGEPLAEGIKFIIHRQTAIKQDYTPPNGQVFDAVAIKNEIDRLTMQNQEQEENIERAVKTSMGSDTKPEEYLDNVNEMLSNARKLQEETVSVTIKNLEEVDAQVKITVEKASQATEQAKISTQKADDAVKEADRAKYWADISESPCVRNSINSAPYPLYSISGNALTVYGNTHTNTEGNTIEVGDKSIDILESTYIAYDENNNIVTTGKIYEQDTLPDVTDNALWFRTDPTKFGGFKFTKDTSNIATPNEDIKGRSFGDAAVCAYGDGKFVSAGGLGKFAYSIDGKNWIDVVDLTRNCKGISYGSNKFVAVCISGHTFYSSDGITWNNGDILPERTFAICYGNDRFVAVGESGRPSYSFNGITWFPSISFTGQNLKAIAYGNGLFVAVGDKILATSNDGINWNVGKIGDAGIPSFKAIAYGNGIFIASSSKIYYSYNGINWIGIATGDTWPGGLGLAYGGGKFISVDLYGVIWTSTNAKDWIRINEITVANKNYYGVTYHNGLFVITGDEGANATIGKFNQIEPYIFTKIAKVNFNLGIKSVEPYQLNTNNYQVFPAMDKTGNNAEWSPQTKENITSWSGMNLSTIIPITLPFTAPADGYVFAMSGTPGSNGAKIGDVQVFGNYIASTYSQPTMTSVSINKNETLKLNSGSFSTLNFIQKKGVA